MINTTTAAKTTARIINIGKTKQILALEITLPDGTTTVSKGNRAVAAKYVAIRSHVTDGKLFTTNHARESLALNYVVNGKASTAHMWSLHGIVPVQPFAGLPR